MLADIIGACDGKRSGEFQLREAGNRAAAEITERKDRKIFRGDFIERHFNGGTNLRNRGEVFCVDAFATRKMLFLRGCRRIDKTRRIAEISSIERNDALADMIILNAWR